jgi:hypothetical protein
VSPVDRSLSVDQFRELLAAFVSVRAEIGNPRKCARDVVRHRLTTKCYGWPAPVSEAEFNRFEANLVIALLACSDVVAVGWETPATRTDEPHPTTTRRGPDGPGDASACPHGVPFPTSCRACGYGGPDAVDP